MIANCKKQDLNLGWTSFVFKAAPMPTEAVCKQACSSNQGCDFYTFIDSIPFNMGQGVNCWCGDFKKSASAIALDPIESVTEVTLKFKKGESYSSSIRDNVDIFNSNFESFQMKIL